MCNHNSSMSTTDIISLTSAIIAFVALFVGFISIRIQIVASIQNQILDKADECNKFIDPITQAAPVNTRGVSAVVSNILFTEALVNLRFRNNFFILWSIGKRACIDLFYLQLHTSIIDFIARNDVGAGVIDEDSLKPKIVEQLNGRNLFLSKSINKYKYL